MNDSRKNLVVTRKLGESVEIWAGEHHITVSVFSRHGNSSGPGSKTVRIAITADERVKILRTECGEYRGKSSG